ncbi:hypothetical protein KKB44_05420 [Candidatus Micrarchaeota archaeon]|nr:hypothetical protein [Candidatus Micrarchaeota archaeon]
MEAAKHLTLNRLSKETKLRLAATVRYGLTAGVPVMEEGLRLLTSPYRPTAQEVSSDGSDVISVYCTHGKSHKPKMTLSHNEARFLLDILTELRTSISVEENLVEAMTRTVSVLLEGRPLPDPLPDQSWQPVLEVVKKFDSGAAQVRLF